MDKAKKDGQALLYLAQHDPHACLYVHLSEVPGDDEFQRTTTGWRRPAWPVDDSVGAILQHLEDIGEAENTISSSPPTTAAEVFTWPDGGMTPFKSTKGTVFEGGFRVRGDHSVGPDTLSPHS